MSRTAFEELLRDARRADRPRRHPPRRHGLLAVQRRLDRLPEGRRAPAPRHPVHVRDVRQGDPRDHRERRHVQLDQALPRVRAGQQPDVPVLGRRDDGAADGQARPARPAGDRAGATGRACSSASRRSTARWSTCRTRATTTSAPSASASAPPSRSRPRSTGAGRPRSTSTSSTASARPRCCTSTAPTGRATSSPGTSGKPVPGLRAGAARRARPAGADGRGRQPARARRQRARLLLAPAREDQGRGQGRPVLHRRPLPRRTTTATTSTRAAPTT